jgi:galactokinase
VSAEAPGRINLIGEHTDYNGGYVLPMPLPQTTRVELSPRDDDAVRIVTTSARRPPFEGRLGATSRTGNWADYAVGCAVVLAERGLPVRGFDSRIDSSVPVGAGLSSSAALEIALLRALRHAFRLDLDDVALALVARSVENDFVGARVGPMDPMVASLGTPGAALFLDTRTLRFERVPVPAGVGFAVIDSGVTHGHAGGEYNRRRAECEEAARQLGVRELRDVVDAALVDALPEPLARRARHVVTENARVLEAVAALRDGDLARLGSLFDASHASMRDDYEVSAPDVDRLADVGRRLPAVAGARLTGGGFGGAVVFAVEPGEERAVAEAIVAEYAAATGRRAGIVLPTSER